MVGIPELIIVLGILGLAVAFGFVRLSARRRPSGLSVNNPNLRPCSDCGQLISMCAAACPHCGGPVTGG